MQLELRRLHYAWLMAGVTFFALLTVAGARSLSGVLILPLQDEFGWSRATISVGVSINLLLFGFGGSFAAAAAATPLIGSPWQL